MRELTVASSIHNLTQTNTADFVFENAQTRPTHVALRRRVDGHWQDVTSRQFVDEVGAVAKGVIAAGIQAGDRVAVMSKTSYEWTIADFALFTAGAVVVPIYETSSAEQVRVDPLRLRCPGRVRRDPTRTPTWWPRSARECPDLGPVWQFEGDALDDLAARRPGHQRRGGGRPAPRLCSSTTSPRSSTPPAPPAGPRVASSATAASSPRCTSCRAASAR